eukprot:5723516-Karenia_brevis.AAC.1
MAMLELTEMMSTSKLFRLPSSQDEREEPLGRSNSSGPSWNSRDFQVFDTGRQGYVQEGIARPEIRQKL